MVDWSLYFPNLSLVFNVKCSITNPISFVFHVACSITIPISFVFHVAHEECKYMSPVLWQVDLILQRFRLPMYWGLYFSNLGLVFTIKCSIIIPIIFVFHVAHEKCKYMSPVLRQVDLIS